MKEHRSIIARYGNETGVRGEETDSSENLSPDSLFQANTVNVLKQSAYGSFSKPTDLTLSFLACSNKEFSEQKLKKRAKANRLIMHIANTKYAVVKHVGKKVYGYKLTKDDSNWDLQWTDTYVSLETIGKMRGYQRINHFPGMEGLARKNLLSNNLNKISKILPGDYDFYPKTWNLPYDATSLYTQFNSKGFQKTLIAKPEASCQGRGIFLTKTLDDFKGDERYVVQTYLEKPLLIEGLKFDMRIYALLAGCDPLRIYVYDKGIARFATVPFEKPQPNNFDNLFMHLTNYAINKKSNKYKCIGEGEDSVTGHKRCLSFIWKYLDSKGMNSANIRKNINEIIIKTICSIQPVLAHLLRSSMNSEFTNKSCFEVLGFDIILDETGKPWLLEVNHSPSFATETKFDWNLKHNLIKDTLQIITVSQKAKNSFLWKQVQEFKRRVMGKSGRTKNVRKVPVLKQIGGYELIYPCGDDRYEKHMRAAEKVWTEFTQGKKLAAKIVIPGLEFTELSKPKPVPETNLIEPYRPVRSRTSLKFVTASGGARSTQKSPNKSYYSPNKNKPAMNINRSSMIMKNSEIQLHVENKPVIISSYKPEPPMQNIINPPSANQRHNNRTLSLFLKEKNPKVMNCPIQTKPQVIKNSTRISSQSNYPKINLVNLFPLLDDDVGLMKIQQINTKKSEDTQSEDYMFGNIKKPKKNTFSYKKS